MIDTVASRKSRNLLSKNWGTFLLKIYANFHVIVQAIRFAVLEVIMSLITITPKITSTELKYVIISQVQCVLLSILIKAKHLIFF